LLTTNATNASIEARQPSPWIERFAIPIAASSMEAQPIALLVALLTLMVGGKMAAPPLAAGGITLIGLGLLWWAMLVERTIRPCLKGGSVIWLHLLGWFMAFVVVVGPRLPLLIRGEQIAAALFEAIVVTWLWRRSIPRAQAGYTYGQVATSFKVGFGVLLGILLIVMVFPELQLLHDALSSSLPAFFLSGLVCLSLVRLGVIQSSRRAPAGSPQSDLTRPWLLALTLFSAALLAVVFALEAFFSFNSFEALLSVLAPLWDALGTLVGWIVYGIIFLLSPLFYLFSSFISLFTNQNATTQQSQNVGTKRSPIHQTWTPQTIPPEVLTIGRWVFLALALLIILLVVRASLRRWFTRDSEQEVEEVREGLDTRSLLGERWHEWWKRWQRKREIFPALEPLDPTSVRACYREMLQAIATANNTLARKPAETPIEYEERLKKHLTQGEPPMENLAASAQLPPEPAILDELTRAYANERYGGKQVDQRQRGRLQSLVPRLIERLTTAKSPKGTSRRPGRSPG
jgi:hypothetical protein